MSEPKSKGGEAAQKVVQLINKSAEELDMSFGDVMEMIIYLNASMADWVANGTNNKGEEVLAQIYSCALHVWEEGNKVDEGEEE